MKESGDSIERKRQYTPHPGPVGKVNGSEAVRGVELQSWKKMHVHIPDLATWWLARVEGSRGKEQGCPRDGEKRVDSGTSLGRSEDSSLSIWAHAAHLGWDWASLWRICHRRGNPQGRGGVFLARGLGAALFVRSTRYAAQQRAGRAQKAVGQARCPVQPHAKPRHARQSLHMHVPSGDTREHGCMKRVRLP